MRGETLEDLKNSLELCNKNIALLQNKKKEIEANPENNYDYTEMLTTINQNTLSAETFLHSLLQFTEFNFSDNNTKETVKEIIQENYTLSIDLFKTPFVARFREAFKLAHSKEKKSIKFAFDLGTELLFNYNLHPAIIAACRSLDELDIYLDYKVISNTRAVNSANLLSFFFIRIPPIFICLYFIIFVQKNIFSTKKA